MRQRAQLGLSLLAILAAGMTLSAVWPPLVASNEADQDGYSQSENPLSPEEIRSLVDRAIENQHRNDLLLDEYARTEHEFLHENGAEGDKDSVRRLIPAGDVVLRVELSHNGQTTNPEYLDEQWRRVARALVACAHGQEIRGAGFYGGDRHHHERAEMVGAIGKAFVFHWAGRMTLGHTTVVKLNFEPDPNYRSSSRFAPLYQRSRGVAWVDESNGQLIKAQAELTDDVAWGGGLIAKLYRGGRFVYEQQEVSPGVWMPTSYSYDFDGRKFLFNLSAHERVEYNDYLRVGPPEQALSEIRHEHPSIFPNTN